MTLKGQTRDPNTLRARYLENSWRYYKAIIVNYKIVYCEAVRSAILVKARLLVSTCIVNATILWRVSLGYWCYLAYYSYCFLLLIIKCKQMIML